MKKFFLVILVTLGFVLGYWMAERNKKLFELPVPVEDSQDAQKAGSVDEKIFTGMDTWQVKEILGPPDRRNVLPGGKDLRNEEWMYDDKGLRLSFSNGFLTSFQEETSSLE